MLSTYMLTLSRSVLTFVLATLSVHPVIDAAPNSTIARLQCQRLISALRESVLPRDFDELTSAKIHQPPPIFLGGFPVSQSESDPVAKNRRSGGQNRMGYRAWGAEGGGYSRGSALPATANRRPRKGNPFEPGGSPQS